MEYKHITPEIALMFHDEIIKKDGGTSGVRSMELLESALAAPQASFGGELILSNPIEIASAYLFYLAKNHPFVDGNKRTALACCLAFLKCNGIGVGKDSRNWEKLAEDVGSSVIDRDEATIRLAKLIKEAEENPT